MNQDSLPSKHNINSSLQIDRELLSVFQDEATELIRNILSNFGSLLTNYSQNKITNIVRDLHTLKGSAQFIAHDNLVSLIHSLESIFKSAHVDSLLEQHEYTTVIQESLSFIEDIISQIQTKRYLLAPVSLIDKLVKIGKDDKSSKKSIPLNMNEETHIQAHSNIFKLNTKDITFITNKILDLTHSHSEINNYYDLQKQMLVQLKELLIEHENTAHKLKQFNINDELKFIIEKINHVQEKATLALNNLSENIKNSGLIYKHQRYLLKQLENNVIQLRLDNFDSYIPRFTQMVDRIGNKLKKEVNLVIEPSNTEVDKQMFEKLMPAFEHLIRNAIDHGIESPSTRITLNKPSIGRIFFRIKRIGQHLIISIRDDGSGIDISSIKQKAIQNNLIGADMILDNHSILQLLLQPGFTTRHHVSDISGRGIGMDVVNHIVKSLGGKIEITHQKNKFTQFDLIMPATFSQHSSIVFEMNKIFYAVSSLDLIGITRVRTNQIKDKKKIDYGNLCYPIVNINKTINQKITSLQKPHYLNAVIIQNNSEPYAVLVDKMIGTHVLVIQSIPKAINHSSAFQGIALLPNSDVVYCIEPVYFQQLWLE